MNNDEMKKTESNRLKNKVQSANANKMAGANSRIPSALNKMPGAKALGPGLGGMMPGNRGANATENIDENEEVEQEQVNPLQSSINRGVETAEEVQETVKKINKIRKIIQVISAISPILIQVLPIIAIIIAIILIPSLLLGKIKDAADMTLNVLTGDGFTKSSELVEKKLTEAEENFYRNDYKYIGEFDRGLLLTTLNHNNIVEPETFDKEESEIKNDKDYDSTKKENEDSFVSSDDAWSMHIYQATLLGNPDFKLTIDSEDKGLIYYLVDFKITWQCAGVDPETGKPLTKADDYFDALGDYMKLSFHKSLSATSETLSDMNVFSNISDLLKFIKRSIAFKDQDKSYMQYIYESEMYALFKDDSYKNKFFLGMFEGADTCVGEYEGGQVKYGPTPVLVKTMNYNSYFNYLKEVFIPVNYYCKKCIGSDFTEEEKKYYSLEIMENIVNERNAYYSSQGENSYLDFEYNDDGKFEINSLSSIYIGDIPVGTKGTGWGQRDKRWADIPLGNSNMGDVGCYVTSIAILMANSGTQINGEYFDPGVLATHLASKGAFDSSGSMTRHAWTELVPKFHQIDKENVFRLNSDLNYGYGKDYDALNNLISSKLQKGYYVQVELKGHFVAVAGIENGRVIISDPAGQGSIYLIDKIAKFRDGAVRSIRVFGE